MIRRGLIAWKQCAQVKMNRQGLKCALTITTPLKTPSQSEVDVVFKLGQEISHDRWVKTISFPVYLLISDIYRVFSGIESPLDSSYISKVDMVRSLEENDYPHRFDVGAINMIYESHALEEMSFYEFA